LTSARRVHHELCSLLLGSLEALNSIGDELANLMPDGEDVGPQRLNWPGDTAAGRESRLAHLSDMAKVLAFNYEKIKRISVVISFHI